MNLIKIFFTDFFVNDTIRMYKKGNIGMYKNGNIPCTKLYIKYAFNCIFFFVTPMLY